MPSLSTVKAILDRKVLPLLTTRGLSSSSTWSHNPNQESNAETTWLHLSVRNLMHEAAHPLHQLVKRINISLHANSSAGLNASVSQDQFRFAGQYSLAWTYFCIVILGAALAIHMYHLWTDKIRRALHKEEAYVSTGTLSNPASPDDHYEMYDLKTNGSGNQLFPREPAPPAAQEEVNVDATLYVPFVNKMFAFVRWIIYRPLRPVWTRKRSLPLPPLSILFISGAALILVVVYSFVPRPLFYRSIAFGSPPLAIRAGMFSVATIPWIIAISMKANFISVITGIGHERLNVLHRFLGYICLILSIIHVIPFYITPVWTDGAESTYGAAKYFAGFSYPYTTGLAAFSALALLCVHSLPFIRSKAYEFFVIVHAPLSVVFLGFMFWHCNNYLTSWSYLWATVGIWVGSIVFRLYFQNWIYFWRTSFLCGEESAITLLPENAVKITIPSQVTWKPGQFVYLRMPGISFFENHPFTIASLCSEDFPSEYGESYRDIVLVFRPFSGFTRKVVEAHERNGPNQTYRAFLDGPYGGTTRELTSFDTVVLVAGGSGITAIISHLLLLIKKMREGTAVTKQVHVIWALKRPETAEWFKEELRICRQFAPPGSVHCQFFITTAKRPQPAEKARNSIEKPQLSPFLHPFGNSRPSSHLHEKVNDAFQGIASKRNSALIREAAEGDPVKEKEFLAETEDEIRPMPKAYVSPTSQNINDVAPYFSPPPKKATLRPQPIMQRLSSSPSPPPASRTTSNPLGIQPSSLPGGFSVDSQEPQSLSAPNFSRRNRAPSMKIQIPVDTATLQGQPPAGTTSFDFGFPSTPTVLQKSLMRFAFMPGLSTNACSKKGWHTEYGRPDIPYMLRQLRRTEFRRRNCVFVCGPPSMRIDVQSCVAGLQSGVWHGDGKVDEIFMHTENYAL